MKQLLILCCYSLVCLSAFGQQNGTWYGFWNSDSTAYGFKDAQGRVTIPTKLDQMFFAHTFSHIVAVTERTDEIWRSYYLTKSGRAIAEDSVYFFDNTPDCESEGFIRFHDQTTDKMGLLNRHGNIAIPARYSALTAVHNGMVIALQDAHKQHWDTTHAGGCNHYSWTGGRELLLDTTGSILIDSFPLNEQLDLSSLRITPTAETDSLRAFFLAGNGQYYSFIDMEKEFDQWLRTSVLKDLSVKNLLQHAQKEICHWRPEEGWVYTSSKTLLAANHHKIKTLLSSLKDTATDYHIFTESLNQFMYTSSDYDGYYNNCGEAENWRYPVKNIVISYQTPGDFYQDHIQFLRTPQGYKLISISLGKDTLQ